MLPADVKGQLDAYVEKGQPMGAFLQAVLENNLVGSFSKADMENQRAMFYIVQYVYERVPMIARGSEKAYVDWIESKAQQREKINLYYVDLDTVDPDDEAFKEHIAKASIVVEPLDARSAFQCFRYFGTRQALTDLINHWFADPYLLEGISVVK